MKTTRCLLIILYLLVVFKFWLMPISSSYWLDETLTYWNVMKGPSEVFQRTAECPGQFQLYMLITALFAEMFGQSEAVLRLPSVIAGLFSSYVMYLLGKRFADEETGLVAAILFACLPEIHPYVSNARPYALLLLCALLALWQLVKFHDSGRWIHGVAYGVSVASMIYMHYISLPFIAVLLFYSVLQILTCDNKAISFYKIAAANIVPLVLSVPLLYLIITSGKDSTALSFSDTPNLYHILSYIFTNSVLIAIFILSLLKFVSYKNIKNIIPVYSLKIDLFICIWFVVPIIIAFIVSVITDYKIFVLRYFLISYPASVLLIAGLIGKINIQSVRIGSVLLVCLYSVMILDSHPHIENWRDAISSVRQLTENRGKVLLLFNSGLIETRWPGWEYQQPDNYRLAPLSAYPVKTEIVPIPLEMTGDARLYLENQVVEKIVAYDKFVVVYRGYASPVESWINERFSVREFKRRMIGPFVGVSVILYERSL